MTKFVDDGCVIIPVGEQFAEFSVHRDRVAGEVLARGELLEAAVRTADTRAFDIVDVEVGEQMQACIEAHHFDQAVTIVGDEGFIARVRAMVAPRKVGMGTLVMVGVVLDRSTPESFASFEQAVAKLKCVLDCHLVAGDFDYFLKIRAGDVDDFKRIHGDQLIALPGVRQTRTFFVMKEVVDNAPLEF